MANSKIPSVQITDTFNTQRGRFNQLVDSVGDVSTLTTTATDITNAIKEHDAELGTISAGAMGTTASTVSTAIAELDGRLDSINTVELLSPRMSLTDGSAINTIAGKLEVSDSADFADNLSVQGNLAVGGNTTMSGTLTVDGEVTFKAGTNSNINLGDANTDNVVFNADVNSNIIPNTDDAYDLGSSTQEWRHVYVDGTVNADNVAADSATIGTLTVTGDTTLNNTITVQDSAYITGDLDLGSNLDVAGNVNVIGTVVSEGALTVEDSAYITGNLDVGGNVTVAGDTTFANTITVQDSAYITGNLDIGGDVTSIGTAFTIAAETGTDDNVSLGDTITFEAGEGINTTVSNNNIKIDGELATSSNKGVASFSTDNFLVSSGVVTIKDNGVALGTETTGNYVATVAGTTNEIEVSGSGSENAAVTIGLPDDVTITGDLSVGGVATLDSVNLTGLLAVTGDMSVSNDFTVSGDFVVQGETRNASSYVLVNDGVAVANANRAGLAVDRPSNDSAVLQWNELGDYWEAGLTTSLYRLALQNDSATFTNIYQTGTGATRLPAGTTGQRPTARQGQVRYNTDLSAFEGYSGSNWGSLGGLIDVDQDTYIVAERVASSDSDTLQFYAAGTKVATLNTSSFDIEVPINVNDNLYVPDTKVIGTTKIDNDLVGGGYLRIHADSGVNGAPGMQFVAGSISAAAAPFSFLTYGGEFNVTGISKAQIGISSQNLTIDPNGSGNKTLLYAKQAPDGENDTHIAFDNSDRIDVKAGIVNITSDSAYFSGDVNISGDLIVSGTTTTINTETLELQDNIIVLNSNSASTPSEDAGLEVERGSSTNVVLKWDEGDDRWQFTNNGTNYYNIPISTEYNNYSLPLATSTVRGGIELFSNTDQSVAANTVSTTAGRTYGVQLNSANQAVVNVPWVNTTYTAGKDIDLNSGAFDIEATLNHVTAITTASDTDFTLTSSGTGLIYMKAKGGGVSHYKDDAYVAGNTYISSLLFQAENASNARRTFAGLEGRRLNSTDGYVRLHASYNNLDQTVIENDGSTGHTSVKAVGDIYLDTTGDTVYMRGDGQAGQQLSFQLGTTEQSITSSDDLLIEANDVISLNANALGSYAATGTPGFYGRIELLAADERDAILFGLDGYAFDKPHQYMVGVGDLTITTLYSNPNNGIAGINKPISPSSRNENINVVANHGLFLKADSAEINVDTQITFKGAYQYPDSENITFLMRPNSAGGSVIRSGNLHVQSTNSTQYYQARSDYAYATSGTHKFQTGNYLNASLNILCDVPNNLTTLNANNALKITSSSSSEVEIASASNLDLIATTDIYLRPTGDTVYMQGTTSSEQLTFQLNSTEQSITSSDSLKLQSSGTMYLKATAGQVVIQQPTVSGASTPMALTFRNNDTSPSDNADLGFILFQGEDTASDIDNTYARIRAQASDVTSSSKNGRILLEVQEDTSGSLANAIIADFNGNGNTTINAGSGGSVHLGSSSRNTNVLGGLMVGQSGNAANDEIRCVGDITAFYSSDRTLKENIVEIDNAMDKITAIRGVYFDWTDEHIEKRGGEDGYWVQKHDVGVIAQEVEEVLPEVVKDRDDGTKAVDYQKMVALLIEGMKEQQVQIDDLKTEIRLMKE